MIRVGGMYVDQEVKVKNYVPHLSKNLAVVNDLACIQDLSPTGSLHSFEPGGDERATQDLEDRIQKAN